MLFVPKKHGTQRRQNEKIRQRKQKAFAFYFNQIIPQKQILLLSHLVFFLSKVADKVWFVGFSHTIGNANN